jgi:microcystin-dependent protein
VYAVVAPLVPKTYTISNQTTGGYAITLEASGGAQTVSIPNGITTQVYCDGSTGFYFASNSSGGNFLVPGNFSAGGTGAILGAVALGSTLTVVGATTLSAGGTSTTPTTGDNSTNIATTAFVQTTISAAGISGQITMWPTASAPSGWLICNGTAVSRTTYATLYGVIGTTFGAGDGSTTFNLPNYQGNVPLGASGTYPLASTGGSADAIVVSHTHTATVTDIGHSHSYSEPAAASNGQGGGGTNTQTLMQNPPPSVNTGTSTTGISVTNATTGSSGTGANLPPYLAINFIIKT